MRRGAENGTPEPTMVFPVSQFVEEHVQNCTLEQTTEFPMEVVPSTPQESVQNRTQEQIVDSVPRVMKAVMEVVPPTPQESVQNRPRKLFVDLPVPLITEIMANVFGLPQERVQNRATYTGKVFTVRHHRDDRACTFDNVGFIKGLDKHNMPRLGDVMVSASQIQDYQGRCGTCGASGFLVR